MSIFIGSAIYSIGFMLTYFTVQSYFTLAILTLAAHGFAFCFVYATSIGAAQSPVESPAEPPASAGVLTKMKS